MPRQYDNGTFPPSACPNEHDTLHAPEEVPMAHPSSPRSAGSMTVAMAAARIPEGPKVLRLGILHDGAVREDRVVRGHRAVSVGTTEKSTFAFEAPGFPAHLDLFPLVEGRYALRITDGMDGRVALPAGVRSLEECVLEK